MNCFLTVSNYKGNIKCSETFECSLPDIAALIQMLSSTMKVFTASVEINGRKTFIYERFGSGSSKTEYLLPEVKPNAIPPGL